MFPDDNDDDENEEGKRREDTKEERWRKMKHREERISRESIFSNYTC